MALNILYLLSVPAKQSKSLPSIKLIYSLMVLSILAFLIKRSNSLKCSASISLKYTITSENFSYSGYTDSYGYTAVAGTISGSLYYLHRIATPGIITSVRKINSNGSLIWMTAISFNPDIKGIFLDKNEQHAYLPVYSTTLKVCRLNTTTGAIVDAQLL